MCKNSIQEPAESGVSVKVDVTKIVKYVCIAGVVIVSVIFITKCLSNILNNN